MPVIPITESKRGLQFQVQPFTDGLIACHAILTLADQETPVYLDPAFAAAAPWLTFHTGAPVTPDPAAARFAAVTGLAALPDGLSVGDDVYPDRSVTLIAPVRLAGRKLRLSGPGIDGARTLDADLCDTALAYLAANRALFPRGFDVILIDDAGGRVIGLPRTTEVTCTSQ